MQILKGLVVVIGVVVLLAGVLFATGHLDLFLYEYFGVKYQDADHRIFKKTRSYNEGKTQELVKLRLEYLRGTKEDKEIIANTIRHAFAEYDSRNLSPELGEFLNKIMRGETP